MQIFFSSDFHLGHDNIRRYCQRPFTDLKHMDTTIINNFNQRVGIDDFCFFLGDVFRKNIQNHYLVRFAVLLRKIGFPFQKINISDLS